MVSKQSIHEEFIKIRCRAGNVGLRDDEQESMGTYNINKCGICGRKWHIHEIPPICQQFREQYPNDESFYDAKITKLLEEILPKEVLSGGMDDYVNGIGDGFNQAISEIKAKIKEAGY